MTTATSTPGPPPATMRMIQTTRQGAPEVLIGKIVLDCRPPGS